MQENSEDSAHSVREIRSTLPQNPLEARRISGCLSWCFAGAPFLGCLFGAAMCSQLQIPARAKFTDSRVLANGIADALIQFYGDYHRVPVPPGQTAGTADVTSDTSPKSGLILILLGREPDGPAKQNTRNINYLEGMKSAKRAQTKDGLKWLGGLVLEDGDPAAVDGWGNYYSIRLDSNGDGEMENPNLIEVGDGRQKLPNRVILWSPGKDRKEETWDDNIKSWD